MAKRLGVSISTLRRWEDEGRAPPSVRTEGGQRRYEVKAEKSSISKRKTIARVSSHDQKEDLERQQKVLEMYCAAKGWKYKLISDLGSGMNYRKKGLKSLMDQIMAGKVERLVLTHKINLKRVRPCKCLSLTLEIKRKCNNVSAWQTRLLIVDDGNFH